MKRQTLRRVLLLTSFVLFFLSPTVHLFLSPVLPVVAALQGVVPASLIIYLLLCVQSLLLGRAFCAWLCPGAALQEGCSALSSRPAGGTGYWLKSVICLAWLSVVLAAMIKAGGWRRIDLLFGTAKTGPWQSFWLACGVFLIIPPMSLALGRWASCHYTCWIAPFLVAGTALGRRWNAPSLRLRVSADACSSCGICVENCPMSLDVQALAASGSMHNPECILCGTCVDECPSHAIRFAFGPRERRRVSA
jgi:ferredoxin-type protein NapH